MADCVRRFASAFDLFFVCTWCSIWLQLLFFHSWHFSTSEIHGCCSELANQGHTHLTPEKTNLKHPSCDAGTASPASTQKPHLEYQKINIRRSEMLGPRPDTQRNDNTRRFRHRDSPCNTDLSLAVAVCCSELY